MLHAIPNPMLLVRGAAANPLEDGGPRAILAPLDGSTLSELSLEHAATMATALKTRIVLMRVNPDAAVYRDYLSPGRGGASGARDADWAAVEELIQNELTDTRDSLDRSANRLTGEFGFVNDVATLPVESRNVAEAIAETAASEGAMVVMTTHGRSGINRLVMGSVTDRVVRHSDLPVLVVRQAETPLGRYAGATGNRDRAAGVRRGGAATGVTRRVRRRPSGWRRGAVQNPASCRLGGSLFRPWFAGRWP